MFGKVLVGGAGFAMAFGLNAFAAGTIELDAPVANKTTGDVTISGTIAGDAESKEATIIVVEQGVSLATVTDEQIRYIDQETAQSGKFSYDFKLVTGKVYDVYCGGTDVTSPANTIADLTSADKLKIVGVVSILKGADATKVTAAVGTEKPVVAKAVVKGDAAYEEGKTKAAYEVEVAGAGNYTVVVGRPGYLYRTVEVTVGDKTETVPEFALIAGDVVKGDEETAAEINLLDLQKLLNAYNSGSADEGYSAEADLNDDKEINLLDLQALLNDYNMDGSAYTAE